MLGNEILLPSVLIWKTHNSYCAFSTVDLILVWIVNPAFALQEKTRQKMLSNEIIPPSIC